MRIQRVRLCFCTDTESKRRLCFCSDTESKRRLLPPNASPWGWLKGSPGHHELQASDRRRLAGRQLALALGPGLPPQKRECYKYAELVAVRAAVRRGSVSSRWWFNMQNGSYESGKGLGN